MTDKSIAGHTPGEWIAERDEQNPAGSQWGVRVRDSFWICDCIDNAGPARSGWGEPNARLMAASKDMLAALQGVLRVADRATDEFDAARAAIAKATGAKQ